MADDSVRKEPLDVDADINEGKDTQLNGNDASPVGDKTSQVCMVF